MGPSLKRPSQISPMVGFNYRGTMSSEESEPVAMPGSLSSCPRKVGPTGTGGSHGRRRAGTGRGDGQGRGRTAGGAAASARAEGQAAATGQRRERASGRAATAGRARGRGDGAAGGAPTCKPGLHFVLASNSLGRLVKTMPTCPRLAEETHGRYNPCPTAVRIESLSKEYQTHAKQQRPTSS